MKEPTGGFIKIVDNVGRLWAKLTYETPLSDLPIIGLKSSLNPLGGFYRKRYNLPEPPEKEKDKLLPMAPTEGPPLPRGLGLGWKRKID